MSDRPDDASDATPAPGDAATRPDVVTPAVPGDPADDGGPGAVDLDATTDGTAGTPDVDAGGDVDADLDGTAVGDADVDRAAGDDEVGAGDAGDDEVGAGAAGDDEASAALADSIDDRDADATEPFARTTVAQVAATPDEIADAEPVGAEHALDEAAWLASSSAVAQEHDDEQLLARERVTPDPARTPESSWAAAHVGADGADPRRDTDDSDAALAPDDGVDEVGGPDVDPHAAAALLTAPGILDTGERGGPTTAGTPVVGPPSAATPVVGPPTAGTPVVGTPGPSGWVVLGRALKPRVTRAQVLAGVLCALLGFALAVQIRQTSDSTLTGMRQADLVRILDEATTRGDALERELADLADERDELLSGSNTRQAALDALRRNAETQGILTGRLPAEGPGVVATLDDVEPDGLIKPVTMVNMLEELRNAGAEAIQLNGQRITASSAFTGSAGSVELDGVTLTAPYVWDVIGDPDTIAPALQIPGGALAEVRRNGGTGSVERADLVEVTAIRVVPDPVHATPVPPESG